MSFFLNGWKVPHVCRFPMYTDICMYIYIYMLCIYTHIHTVCEASLSKRTNRKVYGDSMVCPVCLLVGGLLALIHSSYSFGVRISCFDSSNMLECQAHFPHIFVCNAIRVIFHNISCHQTSMLPSFNPHHLPGSLIGLARRNL